MRHHRRERRCYEKILEFSVTPGHCKKTLFTTAQELRCKVDRWCPSWLEKPQVSRVWFILDAADGNKIALGLGREASLQNTRPSVRLYSSEAQEVEQMKIG